MLFGFGLLFNVPLRPDLPNGGTFYTPQTTVVEGIVPTIPVEPEITSIAKANRGRSSQGYEFPEWRIRKPLVSDTIDFNPGCLFIIYLYLISLFFYSTRFVDIGHPSEKTMTTKEKENVKIFLEEIQKSLDALNEFAAKITSSTIPVSLFILFYFLYFFFIYNFSCRKRRKSRKRIKFLPKSSNRFSSPSNCLLIVARQRIRRASFPIAILIS